MTRINLLPKEEGIRTGVDFERVLLTLCFATALFVFSAIYAINEYEVKMLEEELATLREVSAESAILLRDIAAREKELADIKARLTRIGQWEAEDLHPQSALNELAQAVPRDLWLTHVTISPDRSVKISGITFSLEPVSRFLASLRASPAFKDVRFVSGNRTKTGEQETFGFEIECELRGVS
ncbi:MAG TPA: PilN domain-containing protein [Firmicutes bacterium]|nr:PilN domain-containing protein [Bacillota bacterium]